MPDLTAQRTLVKSPPELWSELSEVETLARHLAELGEIKITKVEPETTVAWEGEQISGTVQLEQAGWGTKVTFNATVPEPEPPPVAEVEADPEPEPEPTPEAVAPAPQADAPVREGFWKRLFGRRNVAERVAATPETLPEPEPVALEPEPEPVADAEPAPTTAEQVQQILDGTLDALGQAHHRPFSRG
jgi:hypothetical protein